MSSVEEAVRQLLLADPAVTALLVDRIYPITSPHQPTTPFAVYQLIDAPESADIEGNPALATNRLQYSFIAENWQDARALLETCRTSALTPANRGTFFGIKIDSILVLDKRDMGFDEATGFYRHDLDLEVWQQLS